jgi:hypothetical protein
VDRKKTGQLKHKKEDDDSERHKNKLGKEDGLVKICNNPLYPQRHLDNNDKLTALTQNTLALPKVGNKGTSEA